MKLNRANSTAWAALLYALGLAVITLSPLTEWRYNPQAPWDYIFAPWPRYWTSFDLLVNFLAYIPFGALLSRALIYRQKTNLNWAPFVGFILAIVAGLLWSVLLEGLQTYLPARRPQLMDVMANSLGAMAGGFLASLYAQGPGRRSVVVDGRPLDIGVVMLIGLWLLAQAAPQQIWLALGDIIPQDSWRPSLGWFAIAPELQTAARESFAAQRILAEALCVAGALLGCALMTHLTLLSSSRWLPAYRPHHWFVTLLTTILLTLLVRAIWISLLSAPGALIAWFNAGVQAGIVLVLLSAYGVAGLKPQHQRMVAMLAITATLILANTLPENGYAAGAAFGDWSGGRWLNLQLISHLAAISWPLAAMAWLGFALNDRVLKTSRP